MSCDRHVHHYVAHDWLSSQEADARLHFCRLTQVGFLRLLTTRAIMEDDVCSLAEAWVVYDRLLKNENVTLLDEPLDIERHFREVTRSKHASPKVWTDSYVAAFADASRLTMVTFDRALRGKVRRLVLLEE